MLLQLISITDSDHILVVDMIVSGPVLSIDRGRQFYVSRFRQAVLLAQSVVVLCGLLSFASPLIQQVEFDIQDRRLNRVDSKVSSDHLMMVFRLRSMNAQQTQAVISITTSYAWVGERGNGRKPPLPTAGEPVLRMMRIT